MRQISGPPYKSPPSVSPASKRSSVISRFISSALLLPAMVICVVATAIVVSAVGGGIAGQNERNVRATQTTIADIDLQYELGLQDLEQGRYGLAAQRFRWILERVPTYPGAAEQLAKAEQLMSAPDIQETALSPGNIENPDELFAQAKNHYDRREWSNAIIYLQELQGLDPYYREVEVKEMLYVALKTLGLSYVRGNRIEEGLFLLEQAAEIRPLDDQTEGERYLANLYLAGKSYWDLSWDIVIENFQIIYELAPNYRDVAGQLWEARVEYADQLVAQGAQCIAAEQYQAALEMREDDAIREKYDAAEEACANPTPLPTATPPTTPGPTPTETPVGNIP